MLTSQSTTRQDAAAVGDGGSREAATPRTFAPTTFCRPLGIAGVVVAAPFFAWVPLGLLGGVPSMVDVFGIAGLRAPAAVAIAGLLVAAVGFHEQWTDVGADGGSGPLNDREIEETT